MKHINGTAVSLVVCGLLASAGQLRAIEVTVTSDPNVLAGTILGPGITLVAASYQGAAVASGLFKGGMAAGIGIESGILLTTGYAMNVQGTANTSDDITGDNGSPGSVILDQLIPGYTTLDATLLTLTFETAGGDLFFNYVFGSDEYNEYVGSEFNDVFGFFLNGTALENNIALIPGTTTPVAINNVNHDNNSAYFNNNDLWGPWEIDPADAFPFEYDGFTTVLPASALGLGPGQHTITLAIADAGDHILDSGVFIQGGTFADIPLPPGNGVPDGGATWLLLGLAVTGLGALRRKV